MNNGKMKDAMVNFVPNMIKLIYVIGIIFSVVWFFYGAYLFIKKDKKIGMKNMSLGLLAGTATYLSEMLIKVMLNYDFYNNDIIKLVINIPLFVLGIFLFYISRKIKTNF